MFNNFLCFDLSKLIAAMSMSRPGKHIKGRRNGAPGCRPKQRKRYKDKCRERYVARMAEAAE